jgi:alkylation response protein AidB-like acyl-CoA dehydrogenase
VSLDAAEAIALDIPPELVGHGRALQRALLAAEAVGAAGACLRMARDYAVDRQAFGRAIGSFQAIKHKLVEMLRRIEGARSLLAYAGRQWERDPPGFGLAANAARVIAVDALDYAAPENIFIHGGIGATWEHDAQLYYRRAEVSRRLAGGAEAAADAVAGELFARNHP